MTDTSRADSAVSKAPQTWGSYAGKDWLTAREWTVGLKVRESTGAAGRAILLPKRNAEGRAVTEAATHPAPRAADPPAPPT